MRLRVVSLVGACVVGISACGWHLQGSAHLPSVLAATKIAAEDEYTDFYRELRRALLAAGATVPSATPDAAGSTQSSHSGAVVRVRNEVYGQRVAALSARNTPEEFQVFYMVDYSLDIDGVEVLPTQHLEMAANYSYDATAVLAKEREQRSMQQSLARELASRVVRGLASAKRPALE